MDAVSSLSLSTYLFRPPPVSCRSLLPLAPRLKPGFRFPLCWVSSTVVPIAATREPEIELEDRKFELLRAVTNTKRGQGATPDQRSYIEESLVNVESFDAGKPIDLNLLDGTWRLQYTSAPDVLVLLESASTLPFFEVDQIFQKFECRGQSSQGIVRNVVRWSIPRLLQILQFIKSFKRQVPVTRSPQRRSVGGLYYLSFLDNNMLLGRAVGGGGVFVFTRAQALSL